MAKKILVVDDEPHIVKVVKSRLEANGYAVVTASNGEEAIVKAQHEKPGLIILDVLMPGLNGFEVLEKLKQDKATSYIPIIMLTCEGQTDNIFKAQELGVADYLIKPFDAKEMMGLIERYVL